MKTIIFRFMTGLFLAGPLMFLSMALARAEDLQQVEEAGATYCQSCHGDFYLLWLGGAHGNASSDPIFLEAWRAEGNPRECLACHASGYDTSTGTWMEGGVTCEACHGPIPEGHPEAPMPVDRSAKLCGDCHTETYFEWQVSKHRQLELACQSCHDPHATALKAADNSALCAECHRTRSSSFSHSEHSQEGLVCADCHLGKMEGATGQGGHAVRDHSFLVRLSTCNACHAYQMHEPVEVHPEPEEAETVEAITSAEQVVLSGEPGPVSPIGFAALSGLIGMASGMILAPWLERWYRRLSRDEDL